MSKTVRKIFTDKSNGQGEIWEYKDFDEFCSIYQSTAWCSGGVVDKTLRALDYYKVPVYVLRDSENSDFYNKKMYIIINYPKITMFFRNDGVEFYTLDSLIKETEIDYSMYDLLKNLSQKGRMFTDSLKKFMYGKLSDEVLSDYQGVVKIDEYRKNDDFSASKIYIKFTEDRFRDVSNMQDSEFHLAKYASKKYYYGIDWSFRDYYMVDEDFDSGFWYLRLMDDENIKKLLLITKIYVDPKEYSDDEQKILNKANDNCDSLQSLYKILSNLFPKQMEEIVREMTYRMNEQLRDTIFDTIRDDFRKLKEYTGLEYDFFDETIETTVVDLWANAMSIPEKGLSPTKLIEKILSNYLDRNPLNDYEDYWNYENWSEVDKESLNEDLSKLFDYIIDETDTEKFQKYSEIYEHIKDRYGFDRPWEKTEPNGRIVYLTIKNLDPEDLKLELWVRLDSKNYRTKVSLETFETLLNQQQLFPLEKVLKI